MNLPILMQPIDFAHPGADLLVTGFFVVGMLFYLFRLGRDKVMVLVVATYVALAFFRQLDFWERLTGYRVGDDFVALAVTFSVMLVAVFWLLSRSAFTSVFNIGGSFGQVLVMGFLHLGLLVMIGIAFLSPQASNNLSHFLQTFFVSSNAQAFWLLAPWVASVFLKNK